MKGIVIYQENILALILTSVKFNYILTIDFLESQSNGQGRFSECKVKLDVG